MKRLALIICVFALLFTACGTSNQADTMVTPSSTPASPSTQPVPEPSPEPVQAPSPEPDQYPTPETEESENLINIQIGEHILTAELVENSSAEALLKLLANGPVTIDMHDYNSMEKVGELPESLPQNNEHINTESGDLILYQGNSFVIYYGTNSWSLTRLGKIQNVTSQELQNILGEGNVTAVISLATA